MYLLHTSLKASIARFDVGDFEPKLAARYCSGVLALALSVTGDVIYVMSIYITGLFPTTDHNMLFLDWLLIQDSSRASIENFGILGRKTPVRRDVTAERSASDGL